MKKFIYLLLLVSFTSNSEINAQSKSEKRIAARKNRKDKVQFGKASFYAAKFHGRSTYSGEKFDQQKMTAANNSLPMGTWVRVTNIRNGRKVIVRINDRMHPKNRRVIDVSPAAATELGFADGLISIKMEVLGDKQPDEAGTNLSHQ